jgi:hypothetical protein
LYDRADVVQNAICLGETEHLGEMSRTVDVHEQEKSLAELLSSPKRRKFVIAYCENGGNGTAAAESAGFAVPDREASRLLRMDSVLQAIEQHSGIMARVAGISKDTVLDGFLNNSQANIRDYYRDVPILDEDGLPTGRSTVEMIPITELPREHAARIKSLTPTRYGYKIELHDANAARRDIARLTGMEPKENEALTPDDAASLLAAAFDRMEATEQNAESG